MTDRTANTAMQVRENGLVSQSGGLLLAETLRATGLGQGLAGWLARWRAPRAVHDPGKILTDLALTVALGGDCLADVAVLRAQRTRTRRPSLLADHHQAPLRPGRTNPVPVEPRRPGATAGKPRHGQALKISKRPQSQPDSSRSRNIDAKRSPLCLFTFERSAVK
jgi:hypothetical protein